MTLMFNLLNKGMTTVMVFSLLTMPQGAEGEQRELIHKGNEQAWQFVNGPWRTNEAGDLIVPAAHIHTREHHMAFNTERAYGDCVITAKLRWPPASAGPQLIVRALDSRRFYAVMINAQFSAFLFPDEPLMASIWKGSADGYQRMLGYRRKVGLYMSGTHPYQWYDVRVECVGPRLRL